MIAVRVVICDDHRLLLEALSHALSLEGFVIEAATSDPSDAVRAVELYDPDLLLIDLCFPEGDGLTAAREVLSKHPRTRVVIITGTDDPAPLLEAVKAGVSGYVRKGDRMDTIVGALRRAANGERVLDMSLFRRLSTRSAVPDRRASALDALTEQERVVLRLLGEGFTTSEIVVSMGISNSTVRSHVQAILSKLGVHSRLQAVACLYADHDGGRHVSLRG